MGLLCQSKHPPHLHIQLRTQIVGIPSRKSIARLSSKETEPKHKRTDSNMDVDLQPLKVLIILEFGELEA